MEERLQICLTITAMLFVTCSWSQVNPDIKDCLPPSIKKQAGKATRYFFDGLTLEIQCIARGGGKLTYTWLKDGAPLDLNSPDIQDRAAMSSGVGTLTLAALEKDEGIYQCSVTNECGTSLSEKTPVKLARMDPFPLSDKPVELKRVQGTSLILTCNPPESVPKPKITWIIRVSRNYLDITDDTPGFSTVQMDRRITMDYNGNLYITSVRKEDEQGGNTYVCQVENRFIRSVTLGADKRISVNDTTMSEMGVELMWYSDTEALVMHGKNARFKCIFSGQPEPTISWTKVIGSYDKTRTSFDDHEMIISNVSYSDAGEYRCMARNQLSKDLVSHTFTLTVEALPKWKNKPHEVVVGVGENATFDCGADGMPKPTIEWFINGRPYAEIPENPNRVLKDDVLSFSNLEKDDSQVIQCNASNVHGFLWSDVYLYVQALPPTIVVKPANETVVAENQDLIVSCQVTGKPKPSLTWYKGNQQLLSDKFVVLDTGNLLIKKTEKKDPGMYRSFAQNKFGEASASGKVNVRDQTRIGTRPIDSKVDYTNSVMCTCGATTDPMESTKLRIRWLKDGVEVKPSNRVFINGGVLSINETNSKDTGNYTCIAENGLDNYTATAKLEVIAVPDPPYNVSLKDCLATKATIEWKFDEKMSNFETMIRFIVEYNTEYKPGVWVEMVSTDYPTNRATVDLSPFAKYKFRVKAVNRMGTSEASEPTRNSCLTLMSVPDKNPDNVHTDESYTGFLVVKWNPVEQIDHNGPSFRYVVQVQEKGTKYFQTFEVNDYTTTEKHIPVNTIFRPYYITVRSENQVGKASNKPVTYTGYSGEAPPLVIPDNFELDPDVNVTATSAGFRWDPVDTNPEVIRGEFSGYKIRFWKVDEKETTLHEHIISPEPSNRNRKRRNSPDGKIRGTIANLPSYADIEADVVVINRNFESNGSNIVNFSTPEGVPGRVAFLKATYKGSHHFVLQWGIPTKPNGIITSYQMSYQKISRLGVGPKIIAYEDIEPEVYQVELKDLEPESQYRVSIMAKTAEGLGEEFYIDVKTISDVSAVTTPATATPVNTTEASTDVNTTEASTTAQTSTTSSATAQTVRQDFECHLDYMFVFIPVDLVPNSQLTLRDPSCRLINNGTHHKISLDYDECGTSQSFYEDYISVENDVNVHNIFNDTAEITFVEDYKIPLRCSVDRSKLVNGIQVLPRESIHESVVQSTDFNMKEFTTKDYNQEITEYPVKLPINREIFFEIALANSSSNSTGIFVEKCEATPSINPNDTVRVSLIHYGCSVIPAVKVLPAPGIDRFRFSIQAFHFSGPANVSNMVYVHCSASTCGGLLCDNPCLQSSRRRKRSARGRASTTLTSGSHVVS